MEHRRVPRFLVDEGGMAVEDGCVAAKVCTDAAKIVSGRSVTHGAKERSFDAIARRWAGHIYDRYGIAVPLTAVDVGMMNIEQKLARATTGKLTRDHFVDVAGYAGCTWEVHEGPAGWVSEMETLRSENADLQIRLIGAEGMIKNLREKST